MSTLIEKEFAAAKQCFNKIAAAKGNEKKAVIVECLKKNDIGWTLLKDYLNPYHVFHIGSKSLESDVVATGKPFRSSAELLCELINAEAINNATISRIKQTFGLFKDETVSLFAKQYITKSLKIGITADTVNKAAKSNVIPTFSCMLAKKYLDNPQSVVGKRIAVTEKLDGIRALTVVDPYMNEEWSCKIKIYSRQGKLITGLAEVEQDIVRAMEALYKKGIFTGTIVLDGELLISDRDDLPSKEQYKKTLQIVSSDNDCKTGITYNVFDVIPKNEFNAGISIATYEQRRDVLEAILPQDTQYKAVNVVPVIAKFSFTDSKKAFQQIMQMVNQMRNLGKEGIMLNDMDAVYVCKRTSNLLKVKVFMDCDLKITGFQEGTGKYQGTLGALLVDYKGNTVGVGSGLTDQQRSFFWSNQQSLIGRVVTVQYFEETSDASGNKSIRFPIFKELREENKEVSYD